MARLVLAASALLSSANALAQGPASASFPDDTSSPGPTPPAAAPSAAAPPAAAPPAAAPPTAAPPAAPTTGEVAPTPEPAPAPVTPPAPPPTAARGYDEPIEPPVAPAKQKASHFLSLTFSPLHLLSPVFEAQVEAKLVPHFGAALIGGAGSVSIESDDSAIDGTKLAAYELGLKLAGYPLSEFDSLQLGAELLYVHVSTEEVNGQAITADAAGVAVGPFVGYKLVTRAGFTFVAQGGFQYVTARGEASDQQGNSAEAEDDDIIPLINLDIGWTF